MAFNLKATNLVDRVETTDKVIRETLFQFWGAVGMDREHQRAATELARRYATVIAPWAREQLPVRGVLAANEVIATALAMEPKVTPWSAPINGALLPRWVLVNAMAESKDLLLWSRGKKALMNALAQALRTDPNPYVRIEVLRAIGNAPVPVTWVPTLLDSITRAEETLPETPFAQQERQTLAKYLRDVKGKLAEIAAPSARLAAAMRLGEPEPTVGKSLDLPPGKPKLDWRPWAALGGAIVVLGGIVLATRKRGARLLMASE
jgi:hypothetical protein